MKNASRRVKLQRMRQNMTEISSQTAQRKKMVTTTKASYQWISVARPLKVALLQYHRC